MPLAPRFDQALQFGVCASGNGHAHRDIFLPAVARQQYLEALRNFNSANRNSE